MCFDDDELSEAEEGHFAERMRSLRLFSAFVDNFSNNGEHRFAAHVRSLSLVLTASEACPPVCGNSGQYIVSSCKLWVLCPLSRGLEARLQEDLAR